RRPKGDGCRVLCLDVSILAEGRDGRAHDTLGEAFVVDIRDIIRPEPVRSAGGEEIFPPELKAQDRTPMMERGLQLSILFNMLLKIFGIGKFLQIASD